VASDFSTYRSDTALRLPTRSDRSIEAVVLLKIGKVPESLSAFGKAIALHEAHNNLAQAQRLRQGLQEMGFQV